MSSEAKLGLFVVTVFIVFLFFTANMGSIFFKKGDRDLKIYFEDIGLLEPGAPVKQAGFDIGEVVSISLDTIQEPTPTIYIVVEARISDNAIISKESIATIQTIGMMGEKYVEIPFGHPVPDDTVEFIYGHGPYEIDQLVQQASNTIQNFNDILSDEEKQKISQLISNLEEMTRGLNKLFGSEESRLESIMDNVASSSAHLRSMMATSELFISDLHDVIKTNQQHVDKTFENFAAISDDVRENMVSDLKDMIAELKHFSNNLTETSEQANRVMAKMDGMLDENKSDIRQTIENVNSLTQKADEATGKINNILEAVETGDGLVHDLIYDKELSNSTKQTVHKSKEILGTVQTIPDRFTFIADMRFFADEPRFDSNDNIFRTDLGLQFDLSDTMYLYAGGNNLGSSNDLELQFGYQWNSLVFHGGMIESEVGLGLDWYILNRWMVGLQGLGLTSDDEERLDAYSEIRLWDQIYLVGGVQDITDQVYPNAGIKVRF